MSTVSHSIRARDHHTSFYFMVLVSCHGEIAARLTVADTADTPSSYTLLCAIPLSPPSLASLVLITRQTCFTPSRDFECVRLSAVGQWAGRQAPIRRGHTSLACLCKSTVIYFLPFTLRLLVRDALGTGAPSVSSDDVVSDVTASTAGVAPTRATRA